MPQPAPAPPLPTIFAAPVISADAPVFASPVCTLGSDSEECTAQGQTAQSDVIIVDRNDLEAEATSRFFDTPVEQRSQSSPPTLDGMLVGDSEESAELARLFTTQVQPHRVYPVSFQRVTAAEATRVTGSKQVSSSFVAVTIAARAPTAEASASASQEAAAEASRLFPSAVAVDPVRLQVSAGKG